MQVLQVISFIIIHNKTVRLPSDACTTKVCRWLEAVWWIAAATGEGRLVVFLGKLAQLKFVVGWK